MQVAAWNRFGWLRHGFSTRGHGHSAAYADEGRPELNLGFTSEDGPEAVNANRLLAATTVGGPRVTLATVRQVHGTVILEVEAEGRAEHSADGLVTRKTDLLLGIMAADCVPILVADTRERLVGAFHAGWRGTAGGIAGLGVARLLAMGARAENLVAAIGPSIGPCCYVVGEEARQAFAGKADGIFLDGALDLWETNRRQLIAAGIPPAQISVVGECTACSQTEAGRRKYFSHRADHGVTGRAMGLIGVASV